MKEGMKGMKCCARVVQELCFMLDAWGDIVLLCCCHIPYLVVHTGALLIFFYKAL